VGLALTVLSGCSAVPDGLNPAEWYNNTVDFFSGENEQGQVASQENPGEDQPFPTLAPAPKEAEVSANQGLVADVEGRKYAQSIARQGEVAPSTMAKAVPAPVPAAAPVQPAPPATPVISVTQAPTPVPTPRQAVQAPTPAKTAELPAAQPANAMPSYEDDPFATVVVSSNGIEMNGTKVSLPEKPAMATSQQAGQVPATGTAPVPSQQRIQAAQSGGVKIATILFGNGSDDLDGQDKRILVQVVQLQKERGGLVRVVGHSSSRTRDMDPVRHAMVNYNLSSARANKIAATLIRQGMPAEVLLVDSRSDSMPLYAENMPSGEAGNRRAEVYFVN